MPGGNGEWLPGSGRLTGDIRKYKVKKWMRRHPNASRAQIRRAVGKIYGRVPDRSRARSNRFR